MQLFCFVIWFVSLGFAGLFLRFAYFVYLLVWFVCLLLVGAGWLVVVCFVQEQLLDLGKTCADADLGKLRAELVSEWKDDYVLFVRRLVSLVAIALMLNE